MHHEGDEALRMHGVSWDVSAEEQFREDILRRQHELEILFGSMYEGLVVHDTSGNCIHFNPAALRIMRITAEQLRNAPLTAGYWRVIKEDGSSFTNPEYPTSVTLATGQPQINVVMGIYYDEDKIVWLSVTTAPLYREGEGKPYASFSTFVDITDRRQAEEELLRRSQQLELEKKKFEGLVYALNRAAKVCITDADDVITLANEKLVASTGLTVDQILGARYGRLFSDNHLDDEFFGDIRATIGAGRVWHGEVRSSGIKSPDGSSDCWLDTTVVPLLDAQQKVRQVFYIQFDITERKELERQLRCSREAERQANDAKSAFLATMSHEMRTPLNGVIGTCSLLAESELTAEQQEQLEVITSSGRLLLTLIDDVLDFSKIEAGKLELAQVEFDAVTALGDVCKSLKSIAEQKGISFQMELPQTPTWLIGDDGRIRQVLYNLVGNAVKFTSVGGVTVRVSVADRAAGQVELGIVVQDTGIGIPELAMEKLFTAFTQADTTTRRRFGGTGLGLSITKGLLNLLNGSISVESQVGVGSVFRVTIPLRRSAPHEDANCRCGRPFSPMTAKELRSISGPEQTPAPSPSLRNETRTKIDQKKSKKKNDRKVHILVPEDNTINQRIISRMLTTLGYAHDIVENGEQAVLSMRKKPYDLVLMDCQMPEMDGYEATRLIRTMEKELNRPRIPIIALTANALRGDEEVCRESGMDDYLPKPIILPRLAAMLQKYLSMEGECH